MAGSGSEDLQHEVFNMSNQLFNASDILSDWRASLMTGSMAGEAQSSGSEEHHFSFDLLSNLDQPDNTSNVEYNSTVTTNGNASELLQFDDLVDDQEISTNSQPTVEQSNEDDNRPRCPFTNKRTLDDIISPVEPDEQESRSSSPTPPRKILKSESPSEQNSLDSQQQEQEQQTHEQQLSTMDANYKQNQANATSVDTDSYYSTDSEIDIDDLLEKDVRPGVSTSASTSKDQNNEEAIPQPHEERKKMVLKKRNQNYFDILPEGWIEVTHFSGMPIYLHKSSRVCTMAKPYHLGPGSARKHEIPVSAIPCLQYRRELEKEKQDKEKPKETVDEAQPQPDANQNGETSTDTTPAVVNNNHPKNKKGKAAAAKVETVKDNRKEKSLNYKQVFEYCQKLFEFNEITIRKFKTWSDRRKHMQARKEKQRPSLPEGTKLITCPLPRATSGSSAPGPSSKKEFVMNPAGKSYICILHEFVQHTERVQPQYVFKELENASQPYSATVKIKDIAYGVGYGTSKKFAKLDAARASLEILIPGFFDIVPDSTTGRLDSQQQDLVYFDTIEIKDPRISELSNTAGLYSPYQILVECLKRNFGMGDTEIKTSVKTVFHQKIEFHMQVASKKAKVRCKNKRDGKQIAAQHILADLHPELKYWGQLLRMYGRGSCKTPKEKKEEEQQITELQSTACANKPNYAILTKLKDEMVKLHQNGSPSTDADASSEQQVQQSSLHCPSEILKNIKL